MNQKHPTPQAIFFHPFHAPITYAHAAVLSNWGLKTASISVPTYSSFFAVSSSGGAAFVVLPGYMLPVCSSGAAALVVLSG
jgi:hypothetical protein